MRRHFVVELHNDARCLLSGDPSSTVLDPANIHPSSIVSRRFHEVRQMKLPAGKFHTAPSICVETPSCSAVESGVVGDRCRCCLNPKPASSRRSATPLKASTLSAPPPQQLDNITSYDQFITEQPASAYFSAVKSSLHRPLPRTSNLARLYIFSPRRDLQVQQQ